MIKVNKADVEISGSGRTILAEFAEITGSLKSSIMDAGISEFDAKHMLRDAFELGLVVEDEDEE